MREDFKSGFVTLIGRPNVGKSTLMNHLIGQKIAITSNKPQTTRNRIQTVLTTEEGQIVFVDTPGIHKAKNKLGEYMVNIAERSLNEVDVVLWLVEPSAFIGAGDRHIIEQLKKVKTPVVLVINKIDMVKKEEILTFIDAYRKEYDFAEIVPVSARSGDNTDELIKVILKYLPYGPQFYDEDTVTDQPERQIVAELIRENPDYGEVICRCEKVTKAEILQAIHNPLGVDTMTGVKYRTRSMMGRCQGGYCQMRIEQLIEQELGKKETEVQYEREGSNVLFGKVREV